MKSFRTQSLLAAACLAGIGFAPSAHAVDITSSVVNPSFELGTSSVGPGDDNRLGGTDNGWYNWAAIEHGMHWWQPSNTDRSSLQNNEFFDTGFGGMAPAGDFVLAMRTQSYDYNQYGGASGFDQYTYADQFGNRQFNPGFGGTTVDGTVYDWALDGGADNSLGYYVGGSRDRQSAVGMTIEDFDPTARYILSVQVGRLPEGTGPSYDGSGLNAGERIDINDGTTVLGSSSRFINDAPAQWGGYAVELLAGAADGSTLSRLTDNSGGGDEIWIYSNSTDINDANHIATIASDENGVAIAENTFGTSTIEYTPGISGNFGVLDGKALMVRLSALELADHKETTVAAFDNIQLTKIYAGDANEDDFVNGTDANIWRANFGSTSGNWSTADFTGDGNVGGADLNLWRANFGVAPSSSAEPEVLSSFVATAIEGDNTADFFYDPTTGELSVKADGESIWSMNFTTDEDASATNLPTAQWGFSDFGGSIEWTDQFAGAFPLTGDFILGTLATGLTESDFGQVTYFTLADFETHFGVVEVVPEPTSLALLGLGGLLLTRRRRD